MKSYYYLEVVSFDGQTITLILSWMDIHQKKKGLHWILGVFFFFSETTKFNIFSRLYMTQHNDVRNHKR